VSKVRTRLRLRLRVRPLVFGLAAFFSARGMCLREAGRVEEATAAFAAAARLAPGCRGYHVVLASLPASSHPTPPPTAETAATTASERAPNL